MLKNNRKRILISILFLGLLVSFFTFYDPIKRMITHSSRFYDDNELEEKNISEIYDTMYATLLDSQAVVVSTTNPDAVVNSSYAFTDSTPPQKIFSPNTNGFILMEFDNLEGDKSSLISTNIIYRLELSEYIVPTRYYNENQADQCTEFIQKGEAYACGGIYKENNKYVFKIKFNDVENRTEIKTSYQFSMRLASSLNDKTVNIVNIAFEQYKTLPVFFQRPATNESDKYSLFVDVEPNMTYYTYNVNVTIRNNLKDGRPFKGYLDIDLGDYLGIQFEPDDYLAEMRMDNFIYDYYYSQPCGEDFCFSGGVYGENGYYSARYSQILGTKNDSTHSGIAKKLRVDLGKNNDYNIGYDITENEVTFTFYIDSYFATDGISSAVFTYHDDYDDDTYSETRVLEYDIEYYGADFSYMLSNTNSYGVPKKITNVIETYVYNSNYLAVTDVTVTPTTSELNGKAYLHYYMPSSIFACEENGPTIRATINYNNVTFTNCHNSLSSLKAEDPLAYEHMKALDPNLISYLEEHPNSNFEIIKSTEEGNDGYYYIVLSNDTYLNMYPDGQNLYSKYANNLYLNNSSESKNPGTFTFRIYNVREQNVNIELDYYLENAEVSRGNGKYVDKHMYTVTNGGGTYSGTINPNLSINSTYLYPYELTSERLNNGYFRWDFSFNDSVLGLTLDEYKTLFEDVYILLDVPNYLVADENIFYDGTKVVSRSSGDHGLLYVNNSLVDYSKGMNAVITSDILTRFGLSETPTLYKVKLLDLVDSNGKINFSLITASGDDANHNLIIKPVLVFTSKSLMNHSLNSSVNTTSGDLKATHAFGGEGTFMYPYLVPIGVSTRYSNGNVLKDWELDLYAFDSTVYNGEVGFVTSSSETDENALAIINNSKLEGIKIENISDSLISGGSTNFIPITSFTENGDMLEYCFDTYHCIEISKDTNNKFFGRKYILKGTKIFNDLDIVLVSSVNLDSLNISGGELNGLSVYVTMDAHNYLKNGTTFTDGGTIGTDYILSAELYVEKKTSSETALRYSNSVSSIVGKTPTSDLYLIDFIDGYDLGTRNSLNKVVFNNHQTNYENIVSLRKNFSVNDVKIYVGEGEEDGSVIYENGSFIDEYSASTFDITNNDSRLYTLHLVKTDGSNLNKYTKVTVEYNLDAITLGDDNIRNSTLYNGDKIKLTTNVKAIRRYGQSSNVPTSALDVHNENIANDYTNKTDETNHLLICYASTEVGKIDYIFLSLPVLSKSFASNRWTVTYSANSAGKNTQNNVALDDALKPVINVGTAHTNEINKVIIQNTKLSNLTVYYTDAQGDRTTVYSADGLWEDEVTLSGVVTGTVKPVKVLSDEDDSRIDIDINVNSLEYGSKVQVYYGMIIDYEKIYNQLISANIIDSNLKLIENSNSTFTFKYVNEVLDSSGRVEGGVVSASSSNISLTTEMPNIKKTVSNNGTKSTWTETFKTGTVSNPIIVEDSYIFGKTYSSLLDEELSKVSANTLLKDLSIKINNEQVYSSGTTKPEWADNITVTLNDNGFKIVFKDSDSNAFIANNCDVIITYVTELNRETYYTNQTGIYYYIDNTVTLNKNNLSSKQTRRASYSLISNIGTSKQYIGNDNNKLSITKWKITANTGTIGRENFKITDDLLLGFDFGGFLSVSSMKITLNNEVIYDPVNNINAGGFTILDNEGNNFELNKDGKYLFEIKFPRLAANSTVVVEYSYSINKEKYIESGNTVGVNTQLLFRNKSILTAGSVSSSTSYIYGYSKIIPKFSKVLDSVSSTYGGGKNVNWKIYVNLADYYNLDELEGKKVVIRDELSDFLNYKSVSVRSFRNAQYSSTYMYNNSDYKVTVDGKVIEIEIVNPRTNPNVEITLITDCLATVDKIDNHASLLIGGEKEEDISATLDTKLYTPYVFGVITSLGKVSYSITGEKLLDGALSNKAFAFALTEVDSEGNPVQDGVHFENANDTDGKIVFNGIEYSSEGTYYYKIKEVKEEDLFEYDDTEYIVKIVVGKNDEQLTIDDVSLLNDKDKIEFKNKTIIPPDAIDIPDTNKNSPVLLVLLIIAGLTGSVIYIKKKDSKKNKKKVY